MIIELLSSSGALMNFKVKTIDRLDYFFKPQSFKVSLKPVGSNPNSLAYGSNCKKVEHQ